MLNLSSDSKHRNQKTHICPVFVNPATAGVDQAEGVETGQEGEGECQGDHGETCGEGNTFLQYQWVVTWCVRSGEPGRTGHSAARLPIYPPQPRTGAPPTFGYTFRYNPPKMAAAPARAWSRI